MLSRVQTLKMRLIGGIGNTMPMVISSINKGWVKPEAEPDLTPVKPMVKYGKN